MTTLRLCNICHWSCFAISTSDKIRALKQIAMNRNRILLLTMFGAMCTCKWFNSYKKQAERSTGNSMLSQQSCASMTVTTLQVHLQPSSTIYLSHSNGSWMYCDLILDSFLIDAHNIGRLHSPGSIYPCWPKLGLNWKRGGIKEGHSRQSHLSSLLHTTSCISSCLPSVSKYH